MSNASHSFFRGTKRAAVAAVTALLLLVAWQAPAQSPQILTTNSFTLLQTDVSVGGNIFLDFNGTVAVSLPLTIVSNTTIFTTSTNLVTLSGGGSNRIFQVNPGVTLILSNLTLSGGNHIGSNGTAGATGSVSGGFGNAGNPGTGGGAAWGGAILNRGTNINFFCLFLTNSATGGKGGTGGTGGSGVSGVGNGGAAGAGGSALGGAIFNMGRLGLFGCTFDGNATTGGVGGTNGLAGTNSSGSSAFPGAGGAGGLAAGGAIYTSNSCVTIVDSCTFEFNFCESGNSQSAGPPNGSGDGSTGPAGPFAGGGALFNLGTNTFVNCTFEENLAVGGAGGNGGSSGFSGIGGAGGAGGGAYGGSFYNTNGALAAFTNCTFASGECFGGTNGAGGAGSHNSGANGVNGGSFGANIANTNGGTLILRASIVAYPTNALNFFGSITDSNFNISSDASGGFNKAGSVTNTDPSLGPLATNGGPTLTLALQPGSPAIDKITDGIAPGLDQRGNTRPFGSFPDIGAYEFGTTLFSVAGKITFNGLGLSNVLVNAGGQATFTLSDGTYSIPNLAAGTYTITPQLANFSFTPASLPVTIGPSTNNVNFTASASTFTLKGQIQFFGTTNGFTNAPIVVNGTNSFNSGITVTNFTDTNGNYAFSNLLAGNYSVTPQPVQGVSYAVASTNVVFSGNTTANFTATLLTFTINGFITLNTSNGPADPNITVVALGTNIFNGTTNYSAKTDGTGAYSLTGLPFAAYTVTPQPAGFYSPANAAFVLLVNTNQNFIAFNAGGGITITRATNQTNVTMSFTGAPNVVYRIQGSTNLLAWTNVTSITNGTNGAFSFQVSTNGFGKRFFRAVTP